MQTHLSVSPVLFLDFDGVLHGAHEVAVDDDGRVVLDNPRLFEHLPLLTEELAPYPELRIIVSSDWQRLFDDASLVRLLGARPSVCGCYQHPCRNKGSCNSSVRGAP